MEYEGGGMVVGFQVGENYELHIPDKRRCGEGRLIITCQSVRLNHLHFPSNRQSRILSETMMAVNKTHKPNKKTFRSNDFLVFCNNSGQTHAHDAAVLEDRIYKCCKP